MAFQEEVHSHSVVDGDSIHVQDVHTELQRRGSADDTRSGDESEVAEPEDDASEARIMALMEVACLEVDVDALVEEDQHYYRDKGLGRTWEHDCRIQNTEESQQQENVDYEVDMDVDWRWAVLDGWRAVCRVLPICYLTLPLSLEDY